MDIMPFFLDDYLWVINCNFESDQWLPLNFSNIYQTTWVFSPGSENCPIIRLMPPAKEPRKSSPVHILVSVAPFRSAWTFCCEHCCYLLVVHGQVADLSARTRTFPNSDIQSVELDTENSYVFLVIHSAPPVPTPRTCAGHQSNISDSFSFRRDVLLFGGGSSTWGWKFRTGDDDCLPCKVEFDCVVQEFVCIVERRRRRTGTSKNLMFKRKT